MTRKIIAEIQAQLKASFCIHRQKGEQNPQLPKKYNKSQMEIAWDMSMEHADISNKNQWLWNFFCLNASCTARDFLSFFYVIKLRQI